MQLGIARMTIGRSNQRRRAAGTPVVIPQGVQFGTAEAFTAGAFNTQGYIPDGTYAPAFSVASGILTRTAAVAAGVYNVAGTTVTVRSGWGSAKNDTEWKALRTTINAGTCAGVYVRTNAQINQYAVAGDNANYPLFHKKLNFTIIGDTFPTPALDGTGRTPHFNYFTAQGCGGIDGSNFFPTTRFCVEKKLLPSIPPQPCAVK